MRWYRNTDLHGRTTGNGYRGEGINKFFIQIYFKKGRIKTVQNYIYNIHKIKIHDNNQHVCRGRMLLLLSHLSHVQLVWPHRRPPTRLLCPWDSPGKNTGVGCHFLLQCMKVKSEKWKVKVKSLSRVRLLATSWTAAHRAPLSMGFSRQEYWSGVPLPSPGEEWQYTILKLFYLTLFRKWYNMIWE